MPAYEPFSARCLMCSQRATCSSSRVALVRLGALGDYAS
jgi:hypothetical protein